MSLKSTIFTIIKSFSGQERIIAIPMAYIEFCGDDYPTSVVLSQLVFWSDKTKVTHKGKQWIVKSDDEWHKETRLSKTVVRRAIKRLKDIGVIDTCLKKFNGVPKTHYHLKTDVFVEKFIAFMQGDFSQLQKAKAAINKSKASKIAIKTEVKNEQHETSTGNSDFEFNSKSNCSKTTSRVESSLTESRLSVKPKVDFQLNLKSLDFNENSKSITEEVKEDLNRRTSTEPISSSISYKIENLTAYMCLQDESLQRKFISDTLRIKNINLSCYFKTLEEIPPLIKEFCTILAMEGRDIEKLYDAWWEFASWVNGNRELSIHRDFLKLLKNRYNRSLEDVEKVYEYLMKKMKASQKNPPHWQAELDRYVGEGWGLQKPKYASDNQIRQKKYYETKAGKGQKTALDIAKEKAAEFKSVKSKYEKTAKDTDNEELCKAYLLSMDILLREINELIGEDALWRQSITQHRNWLGPKLKGLKKGETQMSFNTSGVLQKLANSKKIRGRSGEKSGAKVEKKPTQVSVGVLLEKAERIVENLKNETSSEKIQTLSKTLGQIASMRLTASEQTRLSNLKATAIELLQKVEVDAVTEKQAVA